MIADGSRKRGILGGREALDRPQISIFLLENSKMKIYKIIRTMKIRKNTLKIRNHTFRKKQPKILKTKIRKIKPKILKLQMKEARHRIRAVYG